MYRLHKASNNIISAYTLKHRQMFLCHLKSKDSLAFGNAIRVFGISLQCLPSCSMKKLACLPT